LLRWVLPRCGTYHQPLHLLVGDKLLILFHFSGPGSKGFLDDLASLDADLYQRFILETVYNTDNLSLNFTVAVDGTVSHPFTHIYNLIPNRLEFGVAKTLDLIPNGSNVTVTKENRL
jgi:ubiquitin-protein ligase E3 C